MVLILTGLAIWIWLLLRANRALRQQIESPPPTMRPRFQITMSNKKVYTYDAETEADALKALWADGHDHRKVISVERRAS
jgi:hypothetical protein